MEITYEEFINNILKSRGRFVCDDKYHERHHIIPKSCGGKNDDENLIDLYAREHFEAHRLLALENPDNKKLVSAWWLMSHTKGNDNQEWYEVNSDEYEEARVAFVSSISGENNFWYNRITTTCTNCGEEIKVIPYYYNLYNKNGERHTFCSAECAYEFKSKYYIGENHPMFGKHHTEESKRKNSESHKGKMCGKDNPMFGKHMPEEACRILSNKAKERFKNPENHPNSRKVIRLSDFKIYDYVRGAAKDNNVCKDTMIKYCKLHKDFMYYDEYLITKQNDYGEESLDETKFY